MGIKINNEEYLNYEEQVLKNKKDIKDLFENVGIGIEKIELTGREGLVDQYTITLNNGETTKYYITNGKDGTNGKNGVDGKDGIDGQTGPEGATGATGPKGAQGATGPKGDTGATGPKGDTGATGPEGAQGATGPKGAQGATGPKGDTGATGPKGAEGPIGPIGDKGVKGDTGYTGPQGPQGPVGSQGIRGEKGDTGYTGPQGPQGPQGIQGPAGQTLTIYDDVHSASNPLPSFNDALVGGYLYIDSGGNYDLYIKNTGATNWVIVDDWGGVPGPQGVVGAKGDKGEQGIQGIQGEKGDTGYTGPQGPQGEQGPQGIKGDTGATGPKGNTGATGPEGAEGPIGPKGDKGVKGDTGAVGPVGPKGATGATGPKGDTGAVGPEGDRLVRIFIDDICNVEETVECSLAFVGRYNLINSEFEKIGLNLETLAANWRTLMGGAKALKTWRSLFECVSKGFVFSCFYTEHDGISISPIMEYYSLKVIWLDGTTLKGQIIFAGEDALKHAFASSTMELDR